MTFSGEVWYWRGPAPHHFVWVPDQPREAIAEAARFVSYGWGMVPVRVTLGATSWLTALWPKDGGYIVPLRADARRKERVELGDVVELTVEVMAVSPARARASGLDD